MDVLVIRNLDIKRYGSVRKAGKVSTKVGNVFSYLLFFFEPQR